MNALFSINWMLGAGIWYAANGLLHDIFVLKAHRGGYSRELLRLLMDGHLLIFSGLILFFCWRLAKVQPDYAAAIAFVVASAMIVYCAMIFPFLKSIVTLLISVVLAVVSVYRWAS